MVGSNAIVRVTIDNSSTPQKKGKVTVRGKNSEVLSQFLLNGIWKQTGWK